MKIRTPMRHLHLIFATLLTLSMACAAPVFAQESEAAEVAANDAAVAAVLGALKGKSFAEIYAAYAARRPTQPYPILKRIAISDCYAKLPVVADDARQAALKRRLGRMLSIFEAGEREVILFRGAEPNAFNLPGIALGMSTGLLEALNPSDEELLGIAAHELAHEFFVHLERQPAGASPTESDVARQREIELMCDAVAVAALRELNYDPATYSRMIAKIVEHSAATRSVNDGHKSHPSLTSRLKLISGL